MTAKKPNYASLVEQNPPRIIRSEEENERAIKRLEELERRADSLTADERDYAEILSVLIEKFEESTYAMRPSTPLEILRELMDANHLKQKDLADIFGTVSIVSEVMNGRRRLNVKHIRKLSKRFNVSPALFF